MNDIRQLKLSSGEELICQILDWADEEAGDLVVRHVYGIYTSSPMGDDKGYRYYNIRPWMTMQEGDDAFMTLNIMNVVGQAKPCGKIEKQFWNVVNHSNMSEDELNSKIDEYISKMKDKFDGEDSDFENIILFPGSDKIH
tara:strand:- start:50 stop:469 length:420 start_codon:yes stop_codon:yes gene_type:complete